MHLSVVKPSIAAETRVNASTVCWYFNLVILLGAINVVAYLATARYMSLLQCDADCVKALMGPAIQQSMIWSAVSVPVVVGIDCLYRLFPRTAWSVLIVLSSGLLASASVLYSL